MDSKRLVLASAAVLLVPLASFAVASGRSTPAAAASTPGEDAPARLQPVAAGSGMYRVVLSGEAAERIGIATAPVRALAGAGTSDVADGQLASTPSDGSGRRAAIPHTALLYDANGGTWVYTSPEPLVFVRHPVTIASMDGTDALISDGPSPGTNVVTVGGAQLFGLELYRLGRRLDQ